MQTALVIVDMQRSLLEEETWQPDRVLERVTGMERTARAAGAPIVYVTDSRVAPDPALHPQLSPQDGDRRIVKDYCDAFLGTALDDALRAAGVGRLVVCGLHTDFCIDTTCRRAASLGYEVVLIADAHSTFDRDYMSAEQVIEHHNQILGDFPAGEGRVSVARSHDVVFG